MERLTFRGHKQNALLKGSCCSYSWRSYDCQIEEGREKLKAALEKLAEYEDLEEQGLLLKLPCKLGTKVYYVQRCLAASCKECLGFTRVNNCYCEFKSRIFEQEFGFRHLEAFGKTVFLTQAEAEEALKRMEREE